MTSAGAGRSAWSLWRYARSLYARPGVASACLALQDRHSVDVNILVFCCWRARHRRALSEAQCREAVALTGRWRNEIVVPVRRVRRDVAARRGETPAIAAAYAALKACELELERQQHAMLADSCPENAGLAVDMAGALRLLAAALGIDHRPDANEALATVARAAGRH